MEPQDLLPYLGWIIGGAILVPIAGILASVHNTRMKIKHGYPLEGMWVQSLKPGSDGEATSSALWQTEVPAEIHA